jgi:hypothetical protein
MSEPVSKDAWGQCFLKKLGAVERRAEEARNDKERAELQGQTEDLRAKIRLFDFSSTPSL